MKKSVVLFILLSGVKTSNAQWEITSGPTEPNVTVLAAKENLLLAGCASASNSLGGYRTFNQGDNWAPIGTMLISKFNSLEIDQSNDVVYAGGLNCFYKSTDNGNTFTNTNAGLSPYIVRDIFIDGNNLYTSCQGVYLSTNGGLNWSLNSPVFSSTKMDKSGNVILVGSLNGGVRFSLNNGVSWTNVTAGIPTTIADVKIIGTNFFIATPFGLYTSSNNGIGWAVTDLDINVNSLHLVNSTLFAGCDDGVYFSSNNGISWNFSNSGLTNSTVFSITSDSTYLYAGTTGYVFRKALAEFGVLTSNNNNQNQFALEDFSVLSTNGVLAISKKEAANSFLNIYSIDGKKIKSLVFNEITKQIDLSYLTKGIYIIQIFSENGKSFNRKFILN